VVALVTLAPLSGKSLFEKLQFSLMQDGVLLTSRRILAWTNHKAKKLLGLPLDPVNQRRVELSRQIATEFNFTIRYGPFKGVRYPKEVSWSSGDIAAILLGLYEQEVLQSLAMIPPRYNLFINLGAADGYYGIGVLVAGMFDHAYCYESRDKGQKVLQLSAQTNGVTDRLTIRGTATKDFYKEFSHDSLDRAVIMVDIEGGEFHIFDEAAFKVLRKSIIIIEVHARSENPKLSKLRRDAAHTHRVTEMKTSRRDLSNYVELKDFSDRNRWLLCSEGRKQLMSWLRFDPL